MSKHIARKRFGQHFLTDASIIQAIIDGINPKAGQSMVEIGPGLAAMTQPLVERVGQLTVIELDRDLAVRLQLHPQLHVIQSDVLKIDFCALRDNLNRNTTTTSMQLVEGANPDTASSSAHKLRVVGNLPYNISTPILFHLLGFVEIIEDQHFMLQKEVIDRMIAKPDQSDYSRLSVMLQWRYDMSNILFVPPTAFDPPPRVDSAIVRMVPHATAPLVDVEKLSEVVRIAFSQRRKLLRHTLGKWLDEKSYAGNFDLQRRAQEVPVHEFISLAQGA